MPDPHVVVTGAGGLVGGLVCETLADREIAHTAVHHGDDLARDVPDRTTHVVNAAAATPGPGIGPRRLWDGNVTWIERLIPHLDDRHVIHFGTVSARYRVDAYQVAKLVGESLLCSAAPGFASLTVIPVPTLDDDALVARLAAAATTGERPVVDALRYSACSPHEVARHVVDDLVAGAGGDLRTEERVLSELVAAATDGPFDVGPGVDRTATRDGRPVTTDEALESYLAAFPP